jgi:hypothetical protein
MGWSSEDLLLTLQFNCGLIMVFEKTGIERGIGGDDIKVAFCVKTDENGQLVSQKKVMKDSRCEFVFSFERPKMSHKGEVLYHITRLENIEEIKKNGLKPRVGNCYANHWLSMSGDLFDDIQRHLYPGIFFLSGKRVNGGRRAGYKTVKVNVDDLDPRFLFVDDAWKNEKSFFYTAEIPPEKLIITR